MTPIRCLSPRSLVFLGALTLFAAAGVQAQATSVPDTAPTPAGFSSSRDYQFLADDLNAAAQPASGSGQYDNRGGGGGGSHGLTSRLTWEAGAGFNAPVGNDTPYITWGGNLTLGGGLRIDKYLSILGEYQFMDNKLPGAFVSAGGGTGGNAHINSISVAPVIDLFPKFKNSAYLTGGVGWYHKSTNFTIQECCDFYGYPVTVTANSFSSDQLGASFGIGFTHRLGGVYGDGQAKLFAEARWLYINTPQISETNGLGRTELIPVTLGVRF